jgi:hypothetical protein
LDGLEASYDYNSRLSFFELDGLNFLRGVYDYKLWLSSFFELELLSFFAGIFSYLFPFFERE